MEYQQLRLDARRSSCRSCRHSPVQRFVRAVFLSIVFHRQRHRVTISGNDSQFTLVRRRVGKQTGNAVARIAVFQQGKAFAFVPVLWRAQGGRGNGPASTNRAVCAGSSRLSAGNGPDANVFQNRVLSAYDVSTGKPRCGSCGRAGKSEIGLAGLSRMTGVAPYGFRRRGHVSQPPSGRCSTGGAGQASQSCA